MSIPARRDKDELQPGVVEEEEEEEGGGKLSRPSQKEAAYTPTGLLAVGPVVGGLAWGRRKVDWRRVIFRGPWEGEEEEGGRVRMAPPRVDSDWAEVEEVVERRRAVGGWEGEEGRVWRRRS